MVGRKKKPFAIKVLEGNRGKRKMEPPTLEIAGRPSCPAWLDAAARSEWVRIMRSVPEELLNSLDRGVMTAYCVAWSRLKHATEIIEAEGSLDRTPRGEARQHPAAIQANLAMEQIRKLGAELGFTPASRERIRPQKRERTITDGVLNGQWKPEAKVTVSPAAVAVN